MTFMEMYECNPLRTFYNFIVNLSVLTLVLLQLIGSREYTPFPNFRHLL